MRKILFIILLLSLVSLLSADPKTIVPGVTLERFSSLNGEPQNINVARADLTNPQIHISVGLGDNKITSKGKPYGKEPVSRIAEKHNALLGVNADFFIMESFRDNLNFSLIDGEIVSEPQYNRRVMFIGRDNRIFFDIPKLETKIYTENGKEINITGINRARNTGDVILYTDRFAPSTLSKYDAYDVVIRPIIGDRLRPNCQIIATVEKILPNTKNNTIEPNTFILSATLKTCPDIGCLSVGDMVTLDVRLYAKESLKDIVYATGGGPLLLEKGRINVTSISENFKNDIAKGRAPRTAVGINREGTELILLTCDGRSDYSKGLTLENLASFMKNLGAWNAMNFDGGGSTDMSVLGLVMNSPCETTERNVANALLVSSDYRGREINLAKDYSNLIFRGNSLYNLDEPTDNIIWGTAGGVGYADKDNIFHTTAKDRKGKIGFVHDGIKYVFNTEISNAPINDVSLEIAEKEETGSGIKYNCIAKLTDRNGNYMSFSPIFIYAENGTCDRVRYTADEKGEVKFSVLFYEKKSESSETDANGEIIETKEDTAEKPIKAIRFVLGNFSQTMEF
ncbi:MAG: phosphodiester glycosidase family protein [Armatimonadetes bacterium]|nr:phosphodiester glycosidase family protein [Candidatus Hippobium faecium]